MPGSFIDTNVLIYLALGDAVKADRAEAIIRDGGVISVQVLNEVANVARRKMRMTWGEILAFLGMLRGLLMVQAMTVETHEMGVGLAERYGVSVYDAMIVAAAVQADCDVLWSEDMQDGMVFGGVVRVVNPFRGVG